MPKTNETIVPSPLKRGDQVAIIATARKVSIDILSKAEQILQSWKPYSTVAVWYIWRVIDPDVVQY